MTTHYTHSPRPVGGPISFALKGDRLTVDSGRKVQEVRLGAVETVRMTYEPSRFGLRAFRTKVRLRDGKPVNRPGLAGEFRDHTETTRVAEFNDLAALEHELADRQVACVITEPVLTNSCMVLPEPGFHEALRAPTRSRSEELV